MCDYCGCRSRPLLERLGADHDTIRALIGRILAAEQVDDVAAMRSVAGELAAVLLPHSELEEASLYTEVGDLGVDAEALRDDHRSVDRTVAAAARGDDVALAALPGALAKLRDHIAREEYDLFPAAHQLLTDVAWDRVDGHAHEQDHRRGDHDHAHPHPDGPT